MKTSKMKKALCVIMAVAALASMSVVGFAADPTAAPNPTANTAAGTGSTVPVIVTATAPTFTAIVPLSLPVSVDKNGDVTVASNATVENESTYGKIRVTDVSVLGNYDATAKTGYRIDSYTDKATYGAMKVNSPDYGFQLQGMNVAANGESSMKADKTAVAVGSVATGSDFGTAYPDIAIGSATALPLHYDALMAPQSAGLNGITVGNVVFTIDWAI